MKISAVVLTYKRPEILAKLVDQLKNTKILDEIIVVDNDPDSENGEKFADERSIVYIKMYANLGVSARNFGMERAVGDVVICIDDDVLGLDAGMIEEIRENFLSKNEVAAICFKIVKPRSREISNWCHHCKPELYADTVFATYEISEGAVAFRKKALVESGYYCEEIFISHEGIDLACRIINNGYIIIYLPQIVVEHYHASSGRPSWRRYYYDTKNLFIVAIKNFPLLYGTKFLFRGIFSMFIYSVRDHKLKYYFMGLYDGLFVVPVALRERRVLTREALSYFRGCDKRRPSVLYMVRNRFFTNKIQI